MGGGAGVTWGFFLQLAVEVDQQVGLALVIGVAAHLELAASGLLEALGQQAAVAGPVGAQRRHERESAVLREVGAVVIIAA